MSDGDASKTGKDSEATTDTADALEKKLQQVRGQRPMEDDADKEPEGRAADDKAGEDGKAKDTDAKATGDDGAPTFTDRELRAAKQFGFDAEDLAVLPADKAAALKEKFIKAQSDLGRRYSKIGRAMAELHEQPVSRAVDSGKPADAAGGGDKPVFSADDYGEDGAKLLNAYDARLVKLEAQWTAQQVELARADRARSVREVDGMFAKLDPEMYPVGKGSGADLDSLSDEFDNRMKVLGELEIIQAGYRQVNGEDMPLAEAMEQALLICFPEAHTNKARKGLEGKIQQRRSQQTARATGKAGSPSYKDADEAAMAAVADKDRELGGKFFTR